MKYSTLIREVSFYLKGDHRHMADQGTENT